MNTEKWNIVEHNWSDTTIYDQDHNVVCRISIADEATEENQAELEKIASQRARLIAAAPEMLEILQEIMSWEENAEMTWRPKAFEIIKKAKGEN